ncbi:MAG: hypothetical protein RJQ04_13680 [Longimicrobiales bacterium]
MSGRAPLPGGRTVAVAPALLLAAACSAASDGPPAPDAWRVSATPALTIGAIEGDSAYLFERIASAHFAGDGRIVVADGGLSVVRVFGPDGRFLHQFGRLGDGPGEFRNLQATWMVAPDTVGAWDDRLARLTYASLDGAVARVVTLMPGAGVPTGTHLDFLAGVRSDGSVVIGSVALGDAGADGRRRDVVALHAFDASGTFTDTLATLGGLVRQQMGQATAPLPFSPFPFVAVVRDSVAVTDGSSPTVRLLAPDGGVREVAFPSNEIAPDSARAILRDALEAREAMMLRFLPDAPPTRAVPHIAGLLVDDGGRLWTKVFDPGTDAVWLDGGRQVQGGTWWVADPDGRVVATVALPPSLRPLEVRGDRVLGVGTDALGVQRVAVHTLDGAPGS